MPLITFSLGSTYSEIGGPSFEKKQNKPQKPHFCNPLLAAVYSLCGLVAACSGFCYHVAKIYFICIVKNWSLNEICGPAMVDTSVPQILVL